MKLLMKTGFYLSGWWAWTLSTGELELLTVNVNAILACEGSEEKRENLAFES